ncbi:hypothetical protein [uncultured Oxalicibacterium sp.]|uniref:hypothetical protein n=1 Tax=uncultured Oxalicibacterium sp. TaxID=1168540 RepID=UPI0025F10A27|nr:hypothetical protein [uncultured Oxalicibacterium sp.]
MKKILSRTFLLFVFSTIGMANGAYADAAFAVTGEQLDYQIPAGWKLASIAGAPDGAFHAEYVPSDEDIRSWRKGYLLIKRMPYPSADVMDDIRKGKTRFNELVLAQHMHAANASCSGKNSQMTARVSTFNGIPFAVSGGFCDRYGAAAPYGEGAFVAFAEGRDYFFQIQYGWRPGSEQDAKNNLPWRIPPAQAASYLNSLKAMTLCGGQQQAACKIDYLR